MEEGAAVLPCPAASGASVAALLHAVRQEEEDGAVVPRALQTAASSALSHASSAGPCGARWRSVHEEMQLEEGEGVAVLPGHAANGAVVAAHLHAVPPALRRAASSALSHALAGPCGTRWK